MISRNERRLNRKSAGKGIVGHPVMKRFERNLKRAGRGALEVFRVDGETPEKHVYFDVFSMREWSIANREIMSLPLDWELAERFIASGAVDRQHIVQQTVQTEVRPLIVGRGAGVTGDDQILDGAHTYVAIALAATASGRVGEPVPVPAYLLEADQWRKFLIPSHIAKALDFDATLDGDDRTWSTPAVDWDAHFDA